MLQDEIEQPDKLKFFDDLTSICKDFPESKFTLLIHDDILTRQKDEGFSKGPLGRRLTMVITLLIAHGRTSVVKGVRGEENRGWRRSPLGGNHGNHFYLWWAPCKAPPVMGINVSDNTIFLRAVRHHDDHSHLNSGELSDFHLINTHDLTKDTDFKLPWTQEQRSFIHALSPIRILRGQPGSGKTVSLWQSIQLRPDENVLYLTWSSRLADLAREYFETFASLGSSFRVVIFTDLLHELAGKTPQALAIEEGRRIFLEAISKLSPAQLGPWANYSSTLYSEVRAHYVGAFLPIINGYATNKIDSTIQIKDYQLRRAGYLGKSIEGVISSIKAIEGRALIGSCFPDLALAWEACEKLTSDLAVTTKDLIINRIVLDEVQDLTPIEALAFILLARKIGEKNNGAAPFLLITGDEGQTVRPTDFEWPWLKNLISKVLRPPEDLSLISNLRNPSKINRFVCAISDLYESLPKQDRPRGQEHIDGEEGTIGELIYCEAADNTSLADLITKLTNLTYLFISLSESPPKFLKGKNTSECLSVFEAKGLEFQRVCVINPGCFLGSIFKSEHDGVVLGEVKRMLKRSNIDHMRVAVSRATETLILLDVDSKEKDNKLFKKILEDNDVLTLSPEELLKYLDSDDHDLESKIQMFLETARSLIDVRPELALQRARQAAHLFEGDGSTAKSGDVNLQNDVYLMIMRSVFQCIAIGTGSRSEHNTLLREAYETSMTCEKTGISQVILSFIDFQNEQDGSKKFSLFVKLLENKTKVSVNDRWALNGFNRLYADLKGSLLEFAADTKYCDQISENLNYYFDAIGVPKENIEQESNDILLCLAKNLVSIGSFQKAIEIAKLIHPEPKELLAVWQKSIETKSLQDKQLQKNLLVAPFSEASAKTMQKEIAINLRKAVVEKEDLGNGIKLEMVLIPAGKFVMGATKEELKNSIESDFVVLSNIKISVNKFSETLARREKPHEITLAEPYYIGKYEVTQELWKIVMGNNPSETKGSKLPVTNVSWEECQEFIKKLNAKTNGGYRLPTEAEWEYACRAGTTTAYSFGANITSKDANYDYSNINEPVAVGSYNPNAFGLYDMHGNVWEWCEDWITDYLEGVINDPWQPGIGKERILRGGSFNDSEMFVRSSNRFSDSPSIRRDSYIGFRLARTIQLKIEQGQTDLILSNNVEKLGRPYTEIEAKAAQNETSKNLDIDVHLKVDIKKEINLEFVLIPAGLFLMGSKESENGRYPNETQHEVLINPPFYIGMYVVTQGQWKSVMGNNPSKMKNKKFPVTNVSWNDCQNFIKKLNNLTGDNYRLPTEAEWEYSAKAGVVSAYTYGETISNNDANYCNTSLRLVGSYRPNAFGLYDVQGNVWELCHDRYAEDYQLSSREDPKGGLVDKGVVIKGGGFGSPEIQVRLSVRNGVLANYRDESIGFRLVKTITSALTPPSLVKTSSFSPEGSKTDALAAEESTGTLKPPSESELKTSKSDRASSSDTFSDHNFADSFSNLGETFSHKTKDDEILADSTCIIQLDPEGATIYNSRGESYSVQQRYSEAIADYTKAIEMEPRYAFAYGNRGGIFSLLKKYPEANADYTKSINLYCEHKAQLEAIADFIKVIEIVDPWLVVFYIARGMVHIHQQNYLKAIADFTKAIEMNYKSKLSDAYTARGLAYYQLKNYFKVIADCNNSIKLDPKSQAYSLRAAAHKALGKTKEAIADFAKAKRLEK